MLNVFITVDTEIWCDGWNNIDEKFPDAFSRYVYGPTPRGNFGLPIQFDILNDNGLKAVFFVEPLFATRFGLPPLEEMVGLVHDAGQEVQLHLHTEWVDEAREALLPDVTQKRRFIKMFSRQEQAQLLKAGIELLERAGATQLNAFRAGSFALNADTLLALGDNQIRFDSSYNPASIAGVDEVHTGAPYTQPVEIGAVREYPVTIFRDRGPQSRKHLQLTACSFSEMAHVLNQASDQGLDSVVIVSHNFELMTPSKKREDPVVVARFRKLCEFLASNSDRFCVRGFQGLDEEASTTLAQPEPLLGRMDLTGKRLAIQAMRKVYR